MYLANGNSNTVIIPSISNTYLVTDSMQNKADCVLIFSAGHKWMTTIDHASEGDDDDDHTK